MVTFTREQIDLLQPAINYGDRITNRISKLRDLYHRTINETNSLIDMLYNGKINLSTAPFEFKAKDTSEKETWYKIDKKIMRKSVYKQYTYWQPKRFQGISQDEFIQEFLPVWKPEYEKNIRYQYRNIFSNALAVVVKREKAKDLALSLDYEVVPQQFVNYPNAYTNFGNKITISATDRYGINFVNTNERNSVNYENTDGYPLLYHYRNELDDFMSKLKKYFEIETNRHAAFNAELKELLDPILISRELFLESYGQKSQGTHQHHR